MKISHALINDLIASNYRVIAKHIDRNWVGFVIRLVDIAVSL